MAAVRRFGGRRCILIAGGTDRELDYTEWADMVDRLVPAENLIFLEGSATDKMLGELPERKPSWNPYRSLEACLDAALKRAKALPGATILFSPGAKSFEKFDNEFARGRAFNAVVDRLLRTS